MLKTNKFKEGDIVSIKLISGEEIVTKLGKSIDDGCYLLHKPVVLSATPQGMGLVPYMMTANPEKLDISISNDHIISIAETQDGVVQEYRKATTGIITTSKPGLIN